MDTLTQWSQSISASISSKSMSSMARSSSPSVSSVLMYGLMYRRRVVVVVAAFVDPVPAAHAAEAAAPPAGCQSRPMRLWICWCLIRWAFWRNAFEHTSQRNGFSPVCVRRCTLMLLLLRKPRLQMLHRCTGFSLPSKPLRSPAP